MNFSLIRRFTTFVMALALSFAALNAAAAPMNPSAPDATDGTPMSSLKRDARKMIQVFDDVPYTGDADIDFIAHMIAHRDGANDHANADKPADNPADADADASPDGDARMRQIAELIANGQTKEIDAVRKVPNLPFAPAKARLSQ
jgi:uncharacterized protein (DUF305 family)